MIAAFGRYSVFYTAISRRAYYTKMEFTKYFDIDEEKALQLKVPKSKTDWSVEFSDYCPNDFTVHSVIADGKGNVPFWADPVETEGMKFRQIDQGIDRRSMFNGVKNYQYRLEPYPLGSRIEIRPLNPSGRTGICGRGKLGKWGPNHAADPIVTRWKRDADGEPVSHEQSKKKILQFVSILRRDCQEWAIPGGMVNAGEEVSQTCRREFSEEALRKLELEKEADLSDETVQDALKENFSKVEKFFEENGVEITRGIVDDWRNTDNAWIESVSMNFHDESGDIVGMFPLQAGDDAQAVHWQDIGSEYKLYASHSYMLKEVAQIHDAHFSCDVCVSESEQDTGL